MAHTQVKPAEHVITAVSFAFLLAQLPWLGFCYLAVWGQMPIRVTGDLTWLMVAAIGSVVLSLIGSGLAVPGVRNHVAGLVALILNAVVCLSACGVLLNALMRTY